ncbi:MAG: alpha/beta fold hydrolase, partial [Chloroflexota bacterium]
GHLGVAPPFVLNGHSMGGYIAFEIVRRYPELVGGLVLTSTRAAADSSDGKNGRDQAIKLVQENGIESVVESMLPKLFAQAGFDSESDIVEYTKEVMLETSPEGMVGALEAMRDRPDSLESLAKIDIPTLIIHGSEDQIVPVSEAEAMNDAMPNARLYVIPDAGHMPHLEQPDTYNDVLIDFLEEVDEILTKIE